MQVGVLHISSPLHGKIGIMREQTRFYWQHKPQLMGSAKIHFHQDYTVAQCMEHTYQGTYKVNLKSIKVKHIQSHLGIFLSLKNDYGDLNMSWSVMYQLLPHFSNNLQSISTLVRCDRSVWHWLDTCWILYYLVH